MDRGGYRHRAGATRFGMCLVVAIGLPALARAQSVGEFPLKAPVGNPPPANDYRDDESFIQKLRALRAASAGSARPTNPPATAQGVTNQVVEQPRGLFSRLKPQTTIAAPAATQPATPNRNQLTLDEMYKYASGLASPAEIVATKIKADESGAQSRLAAVQYLGSVDFRHYPEAEAALIAALRADRSESVRFEVVEAFSRGQGLSSTALEALKLTAMGSERDGNPSEPSERIRSAALVALQKHWQGGRPDAPETAPLRLPQISKAPGPVQGNVTQTKAETKVEPLTNDNAKKPSVPSSPRPAVGKAETKSAAKSEPKTEPKTAGMSNDPKGTKPDSLISRWKGTNTTALTEQDKRKLRDDALRDDALRDFAEKVGAPASSEPAKTALKQSESPTLFGAKTEPQKQMPTERPVRPATITAPPPIAGPGATNSIPPEVPPPPPLPTPGASNSNDPPLSSYRLTPIGTPGLK
jgi:hypothetical protein